jgi:type I restriction enzyme S subunit
LTSNQQINAVTPGPNLESEYLYYALGAIAESVKSQAGEQAVPLVNKSDFSGFKIRVPCLEEQRLIAGFLGDADATVTSLERLIAKKQAIKQGMMQQLLTGKTRLPGFAGEWVDKPLRDLVAYEQPIRYLVASADYGSNGTPVLTAGKTFILGYTAETDGIYDALPVIIFDDFTTAAKFVSFPFKAKSSAMKMLTPKPGADLRFVFERILHINFVAVDHKRRWIDEYSKLEVAVPPFEEQQAISLVIEDADAEIDAFKNRLTSVRAIKQGMMQELLTGRTRLIPSGETE